MQRTHLAFVALAITLFYGVGSAVFGDSDGSAFQAVGGVVVALAWVAVGVFGRPGREDRERDRP